MRPARFMAWTASSSGVEQNFSAVERSNVERCNASNDTESRFTICMLTKPDQGEEDLVCRRARQLYLKVKPTGRLRLRARFDKGIPRGPLHVPDGAPLSEAAWLRGRWRAVQEGMMQVGTKTAAPPPASPERRRRARPAEWDKEFKRQKDLQGKRRATALRDGLLLDEEVTDDLRQEARRQEQREDLADSRRLCQVAQATAAIQMVGRRFCWPQKAWLEAGVSRDAAAARGISAESDRLAALVYFVEDINSPGERTQLVAALLGGTIAAASLLQPGGGGPFITYQRNISRCKARLHVTDAFKTKHSDFARCIAAACNHQDSQWLMTRKRCLAAGGVDLNLAIVCKEEADEFDEKQSKSFKVLTKPELLAFLRQYVNCEASGVMSVE